jgi:hypothetical protein
MTTNEHTRSGGFDLHRSLDTDMDRELAATPDPRIHRRFSAVYEVTDK